MGRSVAFSNLTIVLRIEFKSGVYGFNALAILCAGIVVDRLGRDCRELTSLNYVCSELVPIDAAGIETDCRFSATRFGRGPMTKECYLRTIVNLVPWNSFT